MSAKKIKDYLIEKKLYTSTDDILISQLVTNVNISKEALKDIKEVGVKQGRIQNPSIHTYNSAVKNIASLATKLGITIQEKKKIKVNADEAIDLDELLDE